MADGSARLTCEALDEDAEPQCEECGEGSWDLKEGRCDDCFENTEDTSWAAMRREHGTWSL